MSLKAYLAKNGDKIPYNQAIAILQPIMEALVQVHALNLLHRGHQPGNIYITSKGESRLLDFGAARFALGDGKERVGHLKTWLRAGRNSIPATAIRDRGRMFYAHGRYPVPLHYQAASGQIRVERIHGDTMKRPSELGFRIPANVENAIMKALAVKTEDRFPNMEAFIGALNGRVSVQDQVAASISQRTQATAYRQEGYGQIAYQQPAYNGGGAAAGKPSAFSPVPFLYESQSGGCLGFRRWAAGGDRPSVLSFLSALSGGGEKRPTGGGGWWNTPVISQPQTSNRNRQQTQNRQQTRTDNRPRAYYRTSSGNGGAGSRHP